MEISILSKLLDQCKMLQGGGFASVLTGALTIGSEITVVSCESTSTLTDETVAKVKGLWSEIVLRKLPTGGAVSATLSVDKSNLETTQFTPRVTNVAALPIAKIRELLVPSRGPLPSLHSMRRLPSLHGAPLPLSPVRTSRPHMLRQETRSLSSGDEG